MSSSDIEQHFKPMIPVLPAVCHSILDIGSGGALIDLRLARHYGPEVQINLMDSDHHVPHSGKNQVGFQPVTVAWKNRGRGIKAFRAELPEVAVFGHDPDPSLTIPADLIISLRAWGHHFGIPVYIELVKRSLRPGGRIIVDIRNGTDGLEVFDRNGFEVVAEIDAVSQKCRRFALKRRGDD